MWCQAIILCYILNLLRVITTGWRTKCHTIDCARDTFLLLQKHLTSGTELILICWKIIPNEEHVQCDHRFASQPLANEPLHSSQLFDTSLKKARGTTSLCGPWAALHFLVFSGLQRRPEKAANCKDIARAPVTNWEPQSVTFAGFCYAVRHRMKVQLVTPYRGTHLQRGYVTR